MFVKFKTDKVGAIPEITYVRPSEIARVTAAKIHNHTVYHFYSSSNFHFGKLDIADDDEAGNQFIHSLLGLQDDKDA